MKTIYISLLGLFLVACNKPIVYIEDFSETKVGSHAASEIESYLNLIYEDVTFTQVPEGSISDIQLKLSSQAAAAGFPEDQLPEKPESFNIVNTKGKLLIIAPDSRGLLNACYALLEQQGMGFYISGDVFPKVKSWTGFEDWEIEDEPLTGDRFVFNWHNFLSGCTGWNLSDWQLWIDQSNKMRYNGIMVHAYGNNPMFSFDYLGEKKATGYLNNTASGRDWGNQHVNDVRQMAGGHIYDTPVFGAEASMASEENKDKEATKLMQEVFQYAEDRGTKVTFALDFDTWMSTPRNIAEKLPKEALFDLYGGNIGINPEHPEGYKYYKQVIKSLLEMYPQIDQLSVWHRRPQSKPSSWSAWMSFEYKDFPAYWKIEYKAKLKANPAIEDNLQATGIFAYSKIITAILKARDELKPELEISSGSWQFLYVPLADAFYPKEVKLIPLDWMVVFDTEESKKILSDAGSSREVYPVIWAHHDDHRYIGRPYTPWDNLADMLKERNAKGFGVIHWTTRPLDLYFSSSVRQVWQNTKNEPLQNTVDKYVLDLFGSSDKQLSDYYYNWLTSGPLFGRETSDHFIDLGKQQLGHGLESWETMKEKTTQRLDQLNTIDGIDKSSLLLYQQQMEAFYLSFFDNQMLFQSAFEQAKQGDIDQAKETIAQASPSKSIELYTKAIEHVGFTSGEKAIVFSMNTRWLVDFINLRQRVGLEEVRYLFTPSQHDSLAQAPGHYSYHIDEAKNWWRCIGKKELGDPRYSPVYQTADGLEIRPTSIHGQHLPDGQYKITITAEGGKQVAGVFEISNGQVVELQVDEAHKNQLPELSTKKGHILIERNSDYALTSILIASL